MTVKRPNTITSFFKPKVAKLGAESSPGRSISRAAPLTSFDKSKWISELNDEQRDLLQLEIDTLDESWLAVLYPELTKPYFLQLKKFLKAQKEAKKTVFPPEKDVYSWSRLTPLQDVRVVIVGQDPYHNYNQAHGLAFSVNPPTKPPPSLVNIFKGIQKCYSDFKVPTSGLLTDWSKQGVLMLNTCLTVQAHNANSHANQGWEQFTEKVLSALIESQPRGVCFLAWGSPAGKRVDKILPNSKKQNKHLVLRSVHPSPLSAHRGFFECGHFSKVNEWLFERYGPEGVVDWALVKGNKLKDIMALKMTEEERKVYDEREKQAKLEAEEKLAQEKKEAEEKKAREDQARKDAEQFLLDNSSDIEQENEEEEANSKPEKETESGKSV